MSIRSKLFIVYVATIIVAISAVAVLVSLPEARPKNVRVNVMLPQADLEAIDARAREEGVSRSSFLLRAARAALTGPGAGCGAWSDRA